MQFTFKFKPINKLLPICLAAATVLLITYLGQQPTVAQLRSNVTVAFVPNIPGGGLDFHEAAGGHTLDRHVGKTEAELAQRLASETRISAASSFTDRSVAEAAIGEAMNRNQSAIDSWVKSRGNRYTIDYNANRIIGITLRRRASKATSASRLRIVLQRSAKLSPGYFILTAYPQ